MRAVVQRVKEASVTVAGQLVGRVRPGAPGLLALVGAGEGDEQRDALYLADKICGLRIFPDEEGKMNRSLAEAGGSLLIVSQFTLLGDCRKGRRPSFVSAMAPEAAQSLVEELVARARELVEGVETGRFRTHMEVHLVNDGPVTILLDSRRVF